MELVAQVQGPEVGCVYADRCGSRRADAAGVACTHPAANRCPMAVLSASCPGGCAPSLVRRTRAQRCRHRKARRAFFAGVRLGRGPPGLCQPWSLPRATPDTSYAFRDVLQPVLALFVAPSVWHMGIPALCDTPAASAPALLHSRPCSGCGEGGAISSSSGSEVDSEEFWPEFVEVDARVEDERLVVSYRHSSVVRWGVAIAITDWGLDPCSALEEAREEDILMYLADLGVRPGIVALLFGLVQHTLRTMSSEEALRLASQETAPT